MSYTIRIGEAFIHTSDGEMWIDVEDVQHDDAPNFTNDITGRSNDRGPSYLAWSQFAEKTGLEKFFFDKGKGIMREHPGCFLITNKHVKIVEEARKEWEEKHPDTVPGWCPCVECEGLFRKDPSSHDPKKDPTKARILWLEYWMKWALKNCKTPAFYNA